MSDDLQKKTESWCRKVLAATKIVEKSDEQAAAKEDGDSVPTIHHRQSLTEVMRNAAAAVSEYNAAKANKKERDGK